MNNSVRTLAQWYRHHCKDKMLCDSYTAGAAVLTGRNGMGLRWAASADCRILAYAEGGASANRFVPGIGWVVAHDQMAVDPEWAPLFAALGVSS